MNPMLNAIQSQVQATQLYNSACHQAHTLANTPGIEGVHPAPFDHSGPAGPCGPFGPRSRRRRPCADHHHLPHHHCGGHGARSPFGPCPLPVGDNGTPPHPACEIRPDRCGAVGSKEIFKFLTAPITLPFKLLGGLFGK